MLSSKSISQNYKTELSDGNNVIFSDVDVSKGGEGDGVRPHDYLCAALASCLNIYTRMILDNEGCSYSNVTVNVDLDRSSENKSVFKYEIDITGDINESQRTRIISKARNCPVRKTLSKSIEFVEM